MKTEFTFVDEETTGLKVGLHRVWQLAAIRVEVDHSGGVANCRLKEFFSVDIARDTLAHPNPYQEQPVCSPGAALLGTLMRPLSEAIKSPVGHYPRYKIPDGSRFRLLIRTPNPCPSIGENGHLLVHYQVDWTNLYRIVEGAHWVGSNPSFDWGFFQEYLDAVGERPPRMAGHKLIDPTSSAIGMLISGETKSLNQNNIAQAMELGEEPHTALGDAYQLIHIFCRLNNIGIRFLPSYEELLEELPI